MAKEEKIKIGNSTITIERNKLVWPLGNEIQGEYFSVAMSLSEGDSCVVENKETAAGITSCLSKLGCDCWVTSESGVFRVNKGYTAKK